MRVARLAAKAGKLCYSRVARNRFAALRYAFLALVLSSWLLYVILAYLIPQTPLLIPASLLYSKRPLLVVAHPDDESLFFGPTLLALTRSEPKKSLNILVLSSGNNDGKGAARKIELESACRVIQAERCIVHDQDDIQDDPGQWWSPGTVLPVIMSYMQDLKADAIITFDSDGVSGHLNHRAVSMALSAAVYSDPGFLPTFMLRTVSTFFPPRKYLGVLDLPLTSFRYTFRIFRAIFFPNPEHPSVQPFTKRQLVHSIPDPGTTKGDAATTDGLIWKWHATDDRGLIVSSWSTWRTNVAAFMEHSTQVSWDRRLYMLVSRYMWFNEVVRFEPHRYEFEHGNSIPHPID